MRSGEDCRYYAKCWWDRSSSTLHREDECNDCFVKVGADAVSLSTYEHAMGRLKEMEEKAKELEAHSSIVDNRFGKLADIIAEKGAMLKDLQATVDSLRKMGVDAETDGSLEAEIERLKQTLDDFHEASFSMADKEMADEIALLKQRLSALHTIKDRWKKLALKRTKRIKALKAKIGGLEVSRRAWIAKSVNQTFLKNQAINRNTDLKEELVTLWELLRSSKENISSELDNLSSLEARGRAITGDPQQ